MVEIFKKIKKSVKQCLLKIGEDIDILDSHNKLDPEQ